MLALQAPALDADGLVIISLDANQARRVASLARKPGQDFQLASQRGDSNIGGVSPAFADQCDGPGSFNRRMVTDVPLGSAPSRFPPKSAVRSKQYDATDSSKDGSTGGLDGWSAMVLVWWSLVRAFAVPC